MSITYKEQRYKIAEFIKLDLPQEEKQKVLIATRADWISEIKTVLPLFAENNFLTVLLTLSEEKHRNILENTLLKSNLETIQHVWSNFLETGKTNLYWFGLDPMSIVLKRGDTSIIKYCESRLTNLLIGDKTLYFTYFTCILSGSSDYALVVLLKYARCGRLLLANTDPRWKYVDYVKALKVLPESKTEQDKNSTEMLHKFIRCVSIVDTDFSFFEECLNFSLNEKNIELVQEILPLYIQIQLHERRIPAKELFTPQWLQLWGEVCGPQQLEQLLTTCTDKTNPILEEHLTLLELSDDKFNPAFHDQIRYFLKSHPTTGITLADNNLPAIVLRMVGSGNEPAAIIKKLNDMHNYFCKDRALVNDVTLQDDNGNTALHLTFNWAKFGEFINGFGKLVEPNIQNNKKETVFMLAAKMRNDTVLLLLRAFVERYDPNLQDSNGYTALMHATWVYEAATAQELASHPGLDPNIQTTDKQQETVLIMAARNKEADLMGLHRIFGDRYNANLQDSRGYTVLMHAVTNHCPDTVQQLLTHPGIDLTIRNTYKQDVLDIVTDPDAKIDTKTRKLIEVAYAEQTTPPATKNQTCSVHLEQIEKEVRSRKLPLQTQDHLLHYLQAFQEDYTSALEGHDPANIGMSSVHRRKLQGKRVELLDELQDGFLDHLYQDDVITLDQLDELRSCPSRRKRMEKFLSLLPYCGEKAYDSFIAALRATKKDYLADMLEAYDPSAPASDDASRDESQALVPVGSASVSTAPGGESRAEIEAQMAVLYARLSTAH